MFGILKSVEAMNNVGFMNSVGIMNSVGNLGYVELVIVAWIVGE